MKQADYALRLYSYFLSRERGGSVLTAPDTEDAWKVLVEETRKALRLRHRSYNTEKTYLAWLRHFRGFAGDKLPQDLNGEDLQAFLTHLAVEKRVSASTQNQAFNAILFRLRHALGKEMEEAIHAVKARYRRRLPVVLTAQEVERIFEQMSGLHRLMVMLIYGCGLRLSECLQLRIKDLDLEQDLVIVRSGKGGEDRRTMLLERLARGTTRGRSH